MKIEIKLFDGQVMPEFIQKGEWCDLRSNEDVIIRAPYIDKTTTKSGKEYSKWKIEDYTIHLGVAMRIPKGFEAHILPKSSTFNKTKTILVNSQGIIDSSYSGNGDEWRYQCLAMNTCHIKKGQPICQFRIMPSQKATVWQKLRWLFTNKIEFIQTDRLDDVNRGGFGSTDKELEEIKNKQSEKK